MLTPQDMKKRTKIKIIRNKQITKIRAEKLNRDQENDRKH